jgi:hypothetical protein
MSKRSEESRANTFYVSYCNLSKEERNKIDLDKQREELKDYAEFEVKYSAETSALEKECEWRWKLSEERRIRECGPKNLYPKD